MFNNMFNILQEKFSKNGKVLRLMYCFNFKQNFSVLHVINMKKEKLNFIALHMC